MKEFFRKYKKIILLFVIFLFLLFVLFWFLKYRKYDFECFDNESEFLFCPKSYSRGASGYFKEKNKIYYKFDVLAEEKKVKGIDLENFKVYRFDSKKSTSDYAKDKNCVYYQGKKIKEADPTTFKLFHYTAKDKNNCYEDGKIVPMSECDEALEENN